MLDTLRSPLVDENLISLMIKKFKQSVISSQKYDSLVSGRLLKEYLFYDSKFINYSIDKHIKSQNLPDYFIIINGCFISSKSNILHNKFCYGNNPYIYEINKTYSIDIDDEYDLKIARYIYNNII